MIDNNKRDGFTMNCYYGELEIMLVSLWTFVWLALGYYGNYWINGRNIDDN